MPRWILPLCILLAALAASAAPPKLVMVNNRLLAPLRFVSEWLGAQVGFEAKTGKITLTTNERKVMLTINSADATVNGKAVKLDLPAVAQDGVTYVPLRFISEAFGAKISWEQQTRKVYIRHPKTDETLVLQADTPTPATPASILQAVKDGDLARVKALIAEKPALANFTDANNLTPLHAAAAHGRTEVARYLLAEGAQANFVDKSMQAPLHYAAVYGHAAVADLLLAAKANPDAKDLLGQTPLYLAVLCGNLPVAKSLLAHQATVNLRDNLGRTPLYMAVLTCRTEMVDLLLAAKADTNLADKDGITPLGLAIRQGYDDLAAKLKAAGAVK